LSGQDMPWTTLHSSNVAFSGTSTRSFQVGARSTPRNEALGNSLAISTNLYVNVDTYYDVPDSRSTTYIQHLPVTLILLRSGAQTLANRSEIVLVLLCSFEGMVLYIESRGFSLI
jgi:hypothetical protein